MQLVICDVVRQLGKSSMGSVWMHRFGNKMTAVKWITVEDDPGWDRRLRSSSKYSRDQKMTMLLREIATLKRLQHPNIVVLLGVTMFDVTAADGRLRSALQKSQHSLVRIETHGCTCLSLHTKRFLCAPFGFIQGSDI